MPSSKKHAPKVVLDANVWISAMLWGGKPAAIIKAAEMGKVNIIVSEAIIGEISQVLNYPKLTKIYQAENLQHEELMEAVLRVAKFVEVTKKVNVVIDHPADDKYIECTLAAGADYLVSGDKHLLNVGGYKGTRVVSVNEFLQIIESQ